jgi:hypothetical protein
MDAMDLDMDMDVDLVPDEPIATHAQDTPVRICSMLTKEVAY